MSATIERKPMSVRIPAHELAEIDKRARAHHMSRTSFLINSALDKLPDSNSIYQRLEALERRLDRAERLLLGS